MLIQSVVEFIDAVQKDLENLKKVRKWDERVRPWFRGESDDLIKRHEKQPELCPKIWRYSREQENYFVQSFRRKAGRWANAPDHDRTDIWLFWAQHYRLPTRLLDWTEGALLALYFAVNEKWRTNPRVYMLNPHRLNELATTRIKLDYLNYPLSWSPDGKAVGYENIALAWEKRKARRGYYLPMAFPAIFHDARMMSQRSCFTVHGQQLEPLNKLLENDGLNVDECLVEYPVNPGSVGDLLNELKILGVSSSTIFPDLEHLAKDLKLDADNWNPDRSSRSD